MLRCALVRHALAFLGLAPVALGGGFDSPPGFNVETHPDAGSLAHVLPDGSRLLATGAFGSQSLLRRLPDGTLLGFAGPFGSIAGVDRSPVTGDLVVGESFGASPLFVLRDLNGDLDCLDAGERVPHAASLPVLSNGAAPLPYDLAFRPGTDELFVIGATPFGVSPTLGVIVRVEGGAAAIYADGLGYSGGLAFLGDTLYAGDLDTGTFAGRVVALRDLSADGDALDAGEATNFASGLTGANGLAVTHDGRVLVSGLFDFGTFTGSVGLLQPDGNGDGASDGVDEGWLSGFAFSGSLLLEEGAGGLAAGADGDALLTVADFGLDGSVLVRTAPLAGTQLSGTVANNSAFTLTVTGVPGAGALLALSLDTQGVTLSGLGDLGLGFGAPHVILVVSPLDAAGQSALPVLLRDVDALVGSSFVAQGFTLQGGEIGLGDALLLEIAP
ncbi:MAG: hypothetical protein FJ296_06110 [Planctomycetes bacterium]|nr:hypothetical protein [Planctomycetota bacterium]